jgi:hypothetical protein
VLRKFAPRFARITVEREAEWLAAHAVALPAAPDPTSTLPR